MISVNQCTPEISLPTTVRTMRNASTPLMICRICLSLTFHFSCMIAVLMIQIASMVCEDGYDDSSSPSSITGL